MPSRCPDCSGELERVVDEQASLRRVAYRCRHCGALTVDSLLERRRAARVPLEGPIHVVTAGVACAGELRNISLGGLAFTAEACFEVGQTVTLTVRFAGGERVRAVAKIAWRREVGAHYEYGAAFWMQPCPPRLAAMVQP